MAQGSSSNQLTINVRADSTKLRADLAVASAQVGALGRDLKSAAADSLKTGDTTGVQNLAAAFENARDRVTGLRGEIATLAGVGQHFAPAKAAIADMHAGFGRVGDSVRNLANVLAPNLSSKLALGVGGAAAALVKLGTDAAHGITELENLSKVSGFAIKTLEGLKDVFKGVVDRDDINKGVVKFSEELAKARLEAEKTGPEVVKNVTMIRGSLTQAGKDVGGGVRQMVGDVEVLRGAGRQVRDVGDAFKAAGVDVRNFPRNTEGTEAALIAFSKGLSAIKDKTEQARIIEASIPEPIAIELLRIGKEGRLGLISRISAFLGITAAGQRLVATFERELVETEMGRAWLLACVSDDTDTLRRLGALRGVGA